MVAEVSKKDIGLVLSNLTKAFDDELLALSQEELKQRWYFKWDRKASIEWNTYKFSDSLEAHKRHCRRWEEHHHGSSCVVERVRDKYIMPKISEFLVELTRHQEDEVF